MLRTRLALNAQVGAYSIVSFATSGQNPEAQRRDVGHRGNASAANHRDVRA